MVQVEGNRTVSKMDTVALCTEIKLRAERKGGAMLGEMEKNIGGWREKESCSPTRGPQVQCPPKLSEIGITKNQSSRWQAIAAIPEERFEEHVAVTKEKGKELGISYGPRADSGFCEMSPQSCYDFGPDFVHSANALCPRAIHICPYSR